MPHASVNGIELHYREAGEGFPIVLIHGYTGNLRNWALTIPALTEHFRPISMDLRGHGHSSKPTRKEDYALDLMAEDVYQLLEELGVTDCYLAGHSMGGAVAQRLILAHPDLVRALILVDTTASPQALARTRERQRLLQIALEQGMEAAFEEQLRITQIPQVFTTRPDHIEIWRQQFLMTSREAYIYCGEAMGTRPSLLDELRSVQVPTLVICGAKDDPFMQPSRRMHEAIRDSRLAIIPGAGHGPQMERPAEFNPVLLEFLAKVHQTVAAGS